jgi:ribonuclease P protein component
MVLWRRADADASLRLGVITSKKLHLRANKRNFARRRLREAYRNLRPFLSGQYDVMLIGRGAILTADFSDVLRELLKLAGKAGLITPEALERAKEEHGLT